jgi:O-antigen/teichoic acid export membrane protein
MDIIENEIIAPENTPIQQNENLKTIVEGARIDMFGRIFNSGARYIYILIMARLFGVDIVGIFFLGLVITEFCGVFARAGLETGLLKFVSVYRGLSDKGKLKGSIITALSGGVINSLILTLLLFGFASFVANEIFNKPELSIVLKLISWTLPFTTILLIALAVTQACHTLKYRVYVEFIANPIFSILFLAGFAIFINSSAVRLVSFAHITTVVLCVLLALFYLKKIFSELNINKVRPVFEIGKVYRFSLPLLFINILNLLMMWTDVLMVGYFKTAADVGIYNIAVKTAFFINFSVTAFTSIFAPRISDLYFNRKTNELSQLYKIVTRWIFGLSLPLFIIIVLQSKNIMWFFGNEFIAGSACLVILAFGNLSNASVGSIRYILIMSEKEKVVMIDTVFVCILNILLNIILIPKFGINGAAISTAISFVTFNVILIVQVYSYMRIHPYSRAFTKTIFAGSLTIIIGILIHRFFMLNNNLFMFAFNLFLLPMVYFAFMKMFGFEKHDEMILKLIGFKMNA